LLRRKSTARVIMASNQLSGHPASLDDALAAWPDARWNLDAKEDSSVEVLVSAIERTGTLDRVCVTAFSDRRLARVRARLGPSLCTGMGPAAVAALRLASLLPSGVPLAARFSEFGAAQVPMRSGVVPLVDQRLVDGAHRAGLQVHVWTIDTAPVMRRLVDLGVDGIMTDAPTVLRTVLGERGRWPGVRPDDDPAGRTP